MSRKRAAWLSDLLAAMEELPRDEKVTLYAGELAQILDRLEDLERAVQDHRMYEQHIIF